MTKDQKVFLSLVGVILYIGLIMCLLLTALTSDRDEPGFLAVGLVALGLVAAFVGLGKKPEGAENE